MERLHDESYMIIIEEGLFTVGYPLTIKPNFSTLGSSIENSRQEPLISFICGDSGRDLSGFNPETKYDKDNLSPNPLDSFSFNNIFLETDIARGMFFKGK